MVPNKNTTMPTKLLERPSSHKLSCSPAKIMTRAFGEHYDMGGPNSEHSEDPWARGEHEPGVKDPCHKLSRLSPGSAGSCHAPRASSSRQMPKLLHLQHHMASVTSPVERQTQSSSWLKKKLL